MSDDKRGSEGPDHARVKAELYDILVRMGRKVRKEHTVPSLLEDGKEWVIDVADVTDGGHPIFYEVQKGSNKSFRTKQRAFARATGKDLVPIYINQLPREVRRNMVAFRKWVEERVI